MLCLQVFANKIALSEIRKTQPGGSIFYFRYLSVAFQISVTLVSDVCQLRFRHHIKSDPLCCYVIIAER